MLKVQERGQALQQSWILDKGNACGVNIIGSSDSQELPQGLKISVPYYMWMDKFQVIDPPSI